MFMVSTCKNIWLNIRNRSDNTTIFCIVWAPSPLTTPGTCMYACLNAMQIRRHVDIHHSWILMGIFTQRACTGMYACVCTVSLLKHYRSRIEGMCSHSQAHTDFNVNELLLIGGWQLVITFKSCPRNRKRKLLQTLTPRWLNWHVVLYKKVVFHQY